MAAQLSDLEKLQVYTYLGWPAKTNDPTSLQYSKILTDRLLNLSDAILARTRFYLNRLEKLEGMLDTGLSRAGVKRIDDIELNGSELQVLRDEKWRVVRELGVLLDIAVLSSGSMGNVIV